MNRDGYAKAVLRDAMAGIVPEPIRMCRKKVGFNAPIESLIDLTDRSTRERLLSDGPIFEIVCRNGIEGLIRPGRLPNSESKLLFNFLNAKLFLEEFEN
jgi:asparagine synthase (glutamine-hydrolysing)